MPNLLTNALGLGSSLLGSGLLGGGSNTQKGVTFKNEATGASVWAKMNIISVEFPTEAVISEQPLTTGADGTGKKESAAVTGALKKDLPATKIIRPVRAIVVGIVEDISTLDSILSTFVNVPVTIAVSSRGVLAISMVMMKVEVTQEPEILSAMKVTIEFERSGSQISQGAAAKAASDAPKSTSGVQSLLSTAKTALNIVNTVKKLF
jgi:hypothetical protein